MLYIVSWCLEPSQKLGGTSGLNMSYKFDFLFNTYFTNLRRREAEDVWYLSLVLNLRVVVWYYLTIPCLFLLQSTVKLLFLSCPFSANGPFMLLFFPQKILRYSSLWDRLFCMAVVQQLWDDKLVGGICSMLPYDTGICYYALM